MITFGRAERGFSLLELMIVAVILSAVASMGYVALASATTSASVARAKADAIEDVRDALAAMTAELQFARRNVAGEADHFKVLHDLAPGVPLEVRFVLPADSRGDAYTNTIRYRYLNEDQNGNGVLDEGEDTLVVDGALTQRVVRIEQRQEPETGDLIELTRSLGGANHLSDVDVQLRDNLVTMRVTATKVIAGTRRPVAERGATAAEHVSASLSGKVYLVN